MLRSLATSLAVLTLSLVSAAPNRTTFLVPVDKDASWRDLAYLAAIPASERANPGGASLIALGADLQIGPEIRDYARRYRADSLVVLGSATESKTIETAWGSGTFSTVFGGSAEEAAVALSRRFWKTSPIAVVASENDFEAALMAAPLATLRDAPLFFVSDQGPGANTTAELKRLGAKQILVVGKAIPKLGSNVTTLANASAVMALTREKKIPVSYLAAVNPRDRSNYITRKLSLVGAQLAAGRGGLVAPLNMAMEWKRPFETTVFKKSLPSGVPASQAPVQSGALEIGSTKANFLLTGQDDDHGLRLAVDRDGTGNYSESYISGDTLKLAGRNWTVSLGKRTKYGETRVHLTWPTANEMRERLDGFYKALGSPPEHLCLVGFPDALPHAIYGQGGIVEEQTSDMPFAMLGDAQFAQIGVARIVAENLSFGTLYAARALTYNELLNPEWAGQSATAEWENTMDPLFENVGFKSFHMATADVPWAVKPINGQGGQRAPSFAQDSPLAKSSVLSHSEHSAWYALGSMCNWDATVLMAPTVVETGGCATTSLDRHPENRSVVARMLRLGAIGFSGGSRELPAQAQPLRYAFWNGILAGETLGQAHRRALNAGMFVTLEQGEGPNGAYRYCTQVRMQFGDPALKIKLPAAPKTKPASSAVAGDQLVVTAPEKWSVIKGAVPADWKEWFGKDLFYIRGPGVFPMSNWSGKGRDEETPLVKAEFTTPRNVKNIQLENAPAAPMGWSGKWFSQRNANGTYTHRLAVRMVDFDMESGRIRQSVDRLQFRLEFE